MVTTSVSASWNLPGVNGTISSANASTSSANFTVGIIGTIGTGVTGSVNSPVLATSPSDVATNYGATSDIYETYNAFYSQNQTATTYLIPVTDYTSANLTAGIAALKDIGISLFVSPVGSQTATLAEASIAALDTIISPLWNYDQALYGFHITAAVGDAPTLTTLGQSVNSAYTAVIGFPVGSPDAPTVLAGYSAAVIATKMSASPATPLQQLSVAAQATPLIVNTFSAVERNTLYNNGISPTKQQSGNVTIDVCCTTYQKNAAGTADNSYQDVETMFKLSTFIPGLTSYLSSFYMGDSSKILVDDGASISTSGNFNVTTPNAIKASIAAYCTLSAQDFIIEDVDTTNPNIAVTRNGNKVSCYVPIILSGVLRQINFDADFSLS
ncbi:hypothetical protein [Gluconacetobacter diazotrophicus]|uniref:hypothetical protein n=1 Tax=Gluconacetobacter diazotrophicus TaxID=33996 RepID=UPI00119C4027|nr:hypothetical protein [Gluconacetobacter diazotrophicus]TWA98244.1 phage tail sheath gpL-like [Gluconacetobacter diazotrophicus]